MTPLHARVSIDQLPPVGIEATVTCEAWADRSSPRTTVKIELPPNAHQTGGDLVWEGDLAAGQHLSFSATIVFSSPGDSAILARASRRVDARTSWGDLAAVYLSVGLSTSSAGFAPVPREMGIHTGALRQAGSGMLIGMAGGPRLNQGTFEAPAGDDPMDSLIQPRPVAACPGVDVKPGAPEQQPPCGNFASPLGTGTAKPPARPDGAEVKGTTGTLTVTGSWAYYDRDAVYTGAEEYLVELVKADDYTHLAWCYTDLGGNYSCGPATNPGGVGVRTLLYSWTSYNTLAEATPDVLAVVNPDWGTTNDTANSFQTQTGAVVLADGTQDIGSWYVNQGDSFEEAYWTQRDLNDEWRFVFFNNGGGASAGPTTVEWKIDSVDGTYYTAGGNVHLMGIDPLSNKGVVVKHEYAHNVMYTVYGAYFPPNPDCDPHTLQNGYSAGCGWTEGWADFLPLVVNDDPTFYWPSGASQDLEYPTWGTDGWEDGDWVEGRIAGAMWDIYDANDDGDDTYSDGTFANLWEVMDQSVADVFSDWWASWLAQSHNDVSWGPIMDLYQNTVDYRSGPANDDFLAAVAVGTVPFAVTGLDTTNATTQGLDPASSCGSTTYSRQGRSVWYSYTAPTNGEYNVNTIGSDYDTVLAIWSGPWGDLVAEGCDDDGGGDFTSSLDVRLLGGVTYFIEAMGYGASAGGSLDVAVTLLPPPNDDFDAALDSTSLSYADSEDTTNATTAGDDPSFDCGAFFSGQGYGSVWYDFTAPADGTLTADTFGCELDTVMAAWTGPRGSLSMVACDDDAGDVLQSQVSFAVTGGTTYHLEALGYNEFAVGALAFNASYTSTAMLAPIGVETCEGSTATVRLYLPDGAIAGDASVTYATVDGTALAGTDYVASGGNVTVPGGAAGVPILIQTMDDGVTTGPKYFTLQLSNPNPIGLTAASVTIWVDDAGSCLFSDDLETGDTLAWSGVTP